jgi:hypothetical protein
LFLGLGQGSLGVLQHCLQSIELLLEVVGPVALLGVEVLGYSKTLEEVSGVFVPEDGIIASGVFMANQL